MTATSMTAEHQDAMPDRATDDALVAYFADVRARIPAFTARHFGVGGTIRLHAEAISLDLLRAPFNVLLVGPALFLRIIAVLLRRLRLESAARWLASRNLFVETRLSRRMADLILTELLGIREAGQPGTGTTAPVTEAWHDRAHHLIAEYVAARHAVAELGAGLVALVIGLLLLNALTPSAISLGPILANQMAQQEAIENFWLGAGVGQLYHSWWPAHATWTQTVTTTLGAMALFALLATFMGVITDPLQQALGLHRRRLERLVHTLERVACGESAAELALPDPYIARIADVADVVLMAMRITR